MRLMNSFGIRPSIMFDALEEKLRSTLGHPARHTDVFLPEKGKLRTDIGTLKMPGRHRGDVIVPAGRVATKRLRHFSNGMQADA